MKPGKLFPFQDEDAFTCLYKIVGRSRSPRATSNYDSIVGIFSTMRYRFDTIVHSMGVEPFQMQKLAQQGTELRIVIDN